MPDDARHTYRHTRHTITIAMRHALFTSRLLRLRLPLVFPPHYVISLMMIVVADYFAIFRRLISACAQITLDAAISP